MKGVLHPALLAPPKQGLSQGREIGIDLLRIVAAMAVVLIHIHYELVPDVELQPWLRAPARFAVPTFFALSGYFLVESRGRVTGALRRVGRVMLLFVLASLLYLPFALIQHRDLHYLALLTGGTWLHLWFLPALALGLLVVDLMARLHMPKWCSWLLTLALLTALVLADASSVLRGQSDDEARRLVVTLRFLQAFPMIWIGFSLARSRHTLRTGALVFVGGCLLLAVQVAWYHQHGVIDANPEFPVGALPMTIGLIVMARHASFGPSPYPGLPRLLARTAARLTLPLYLLHPMVIVVLDRACAALNGPSDLMVWAETLFLGPGMLFALWVLDRHVPRFVDGLNGIFRLRGSSLS